MLVLWTEEEGEVGGGGIEGRGGGVSSLCHTNLVMKCSRIPIVHGISSVARPPEMLLDKAVSVSEHQATVHKVHADTVRAATAHKTSEELSRPLKRELSWVTLMQTP